MSNEMTILEEEIREAWNNASGCNDSAEGWQTGLGMTDQRWTDPMRYFRLAYISGSSASAAKHAEEVAAMREDLKAQWLKIAGEWDAESAAKDAEIERLKQERNRVRVQFETPLLAQLTAAREREEKAICDLSNEQQAFDEKEAELAAAKKIGKSAEIAVKAIDLILAIKQAEEQDDICASVFDAMEREFKDLLAAYDSSRAADGKEGV